MQNENTSRFFKGASSEDYLAMVYEVCRETGGSAQQVEITARMGFSKPSVMRGLRVLAQRALVTIERSGVNNTVYLTDEGRASAKKLHRRRRIAAAFLASLGLPETKAAAEAHLWEHGISDETADAMEAALNVREAAPDIPAPVFPAPAPPVILQKASCHRSEKPRIVAADGDAKKAASAAPTTTA
jgi:Mn-dependent DtxR family transcriptional regulator